MMGEACVYDLAASPLVTRLVIADPGIGRRQAVLSRIKNRSKIRVTTTDFRDRRRALAEFKGAQLLVNCAWYELNLQAMDLALALGAHYVDLGGLYHMTLKQLKKDPAFRRAGRVAVLGCGSTPGISNVMAQAMTRDLDRVRALWVYDASHDPTINEDAFLPPFSVRTMIDEIEMPAPYFEAGRMKYLPPFSKKETLSFPEPIGSLPATAIIHSEQATIPAYLQRKGLKEHGFKIVYPEAIRAQLELLVKMGFGSGEPVKVNGAQVSPREFLSAFSLKNWTGVKTAPADFEVLRLVVEGAAEGRPVRRVWDCEIRHTKELTAGAIGVGFSASIAAQLLLTGRTLLNAGAAAPESALPADAFFKEMEKRGSFRILERKSRAEVLS